MLQKKCKRHIMYVDLLMIVLMLCGCGDKITRGTSLRQEISDGNQVAIEDKKNENEDDLQELKYTEQPEITSPTPCPDVPPYYVMLGGALMQIKEDVPGDLSEYQVGKVVYNGDYFHLPEEDGQTNYSEYEGCDYALKDGVWYMYFGGQWSKCGWYRLGLDE